MDIYSVYYFVKKNVYGQKIPEKRKILLFELIFNNIILKDKVIFITIKIGTILMV